MELQPPFNSRNERLYREVEFKKDHSEDELQVARDTQPPDMMVMAAVSWYGKFSLRFIEGTLNQRQSLSRDTAVMGRCKAVEERYWMQDGAIPHTANTT